MVEAVVTLLFDRAGNYEAHSSLVDGEWNDMVLSFPTLYLWHLPLQWFSHLV